MTVSPNLPEGQRPDGDRAESVRSDGERTAEFVRLYTAHSRRVYTYLLTLLPQRNEAEEVFQEISVVLWEKFDEFTPGTSFAAWACRVAHFKALRYKERAHRRAKLFREDVLNVLDQEMFAVDDSLDAEYAALAECFAQLSADDRALIERRYQAGGDPRSISSEDGTPLARVYKSLSRIRRALLACVTSKLAEGGRA